MPAIARTTEQMAADRSRKSKIKELIDALAKVGIAMLPDWDPQTPGGKDALLAAVATAAKVKADKAADDKRKQIEAGTMPPEDTEHSAVQFSEHYPKRHVFIPRTRRHAELLLAEINRNIYGQTPKKKPPTDVMRIN
jgi:hypothetical protein